MTKIWPQSGLMFLNKGFVVCEVSAKIRLETASGCTFRLACKLPLILEKLQNANCIKNTSKKKVLFFYLKYWIFYWIFHHCSLTFIESDTLDKKLLVISSFYCKIDNFKYLFSLFFNGIALVSACTKSSNFCVYLCV